MVEFKWHSLSRLTRTTQKGLGPASYLGGDPACRKRPPEEIPFADIRREVFERLNTGGTALAPQELRNSIYGGSFNNLIIDLARDSLFCKMWDIPFPGRNPNSAQLEELQNN